MADDNHEDKQVKNNLSAIRAQVTATNNPAELARLASAAAGLAASTNNPEIIEQIKNLQSAISKKEENAEQVINSDIAAENLKAQEQYQQPHDHEVIREQELHERHENLKTQHAKIMQDADELIENKRKENEGLQSLLNDIRDGKDIDPERLKSFVKTEEQIKEETEKEKALRDHQKQITGHYQELQAEEERLKKQRAGDVKEAEEQRKTNAKLVSKELEQGQQSLYGIETKIQQTDVKLEAIRPKIEVAKKMKDDVDKKVEENEKEINIREEIQKGIQEHKEKNPQKYNSALDDFSTLLLNQTEASKTDVIKDHELRNKFLGKENQSEIPAKTSEEIPAKSPQEIPSISPDIKREEIPLQAQEKQKNIFEKMTRTIGDKILEVKEKFGLVPKEEVVNTQKEVRNGLENQSILPTKNKTTEVDKQLNRTNQQNKKNEGHSR